VATDAEIFQRSIRDPDAFREIFERHAPAVHAYARKRIGSTAGEEILAQTFLTAFEKRSRFDTSYGSARPWLLGIATNLIRHHLREEREHLTALGKVVREQPEAPVDERRAPRRPADEAETGRRASDTLGRRPGDALAPRARAAQL
jgi:RNA polymerase sigma factor (sigma-70 family)